ncbi:hypothetical protein [Tannerella sp.]|uniref:hypothetical protein n=1 Tax=Tannerella sp. TaxID=2382127 RepID=UPI0026DD3120|nr:hypothetical protein [Tannerella sp.]MDO4702609.1 hypothetical protein [Tannerella sp.]
MKKTMKNVAGSLLCMLFALVWLFGCSGIKKEQADGEEDAATFVYEIEDIFELKDNGVVVVGEVLDGKLKVGDKVNYYDSVGDKIFVCTISAIEQPPQTGLKEASAEGERTHYAFMIENKGKTDFEIKGYLVKGDLHKWLAQEE